MAAIARFGQAINRWITGKARDVENSQINERADEAAEKAQGAADKVTLATAETAGQLSVLKKQMGNLQTEVDSWTGKAKAAQKAGKPELARKAAKEAVQAKTRLDSITAQYDELKGRVDGYKAKAERAQDQAEDAKFQAENIKNRNKFANAEKDVHDAIHGADGSGVANSISDLDKLVTQKEGRNEALAEMSGDKTADEFAALEEQQDVDAFLAGLDSPSAEQKPADSDVDYNIAG